MGLTLKYLFILSICFLKFTKSHAQEIIFSKNIADASGAVEVVSAGKYTVQYTGGFGVQKDFIMFPELIGVSEKNSLYLKYVATSKGYLTFRADMIQGSFQVVIFKGSKEGIISEFQDGSAEIVYKNLKFVKSIKQEANIEPLYLKEGQVVLLMFNAAKKQKNSLDLEIKFKNEDGETNMVTENKFVDYRVKYAHHSFLIKIRDSETNEPLVASINIKSKKESNLYHGSDIIFDNDIQTKLTIKCDAPGYFFADTNYTLIPDSSKTLTIPMRAVSLGKVLKIDRIEFAKGSAKLIPGTESILIRVKDFLVLNADVKIEIQGHVNNEGKESLRTKKLSSKRAKTIMKYFIESGLNKDRMSIKGFGSEFPIYPEPKNEREEQANRRVEIKIMN